jgi:hypothetical protein
LGAKRERARAHWRVHSPSICGERIARVTLELGGKPAAVILDDIDIETAARTLSQAECFQPEGYEDPAL